MGRIEGETRAEILGRRTLCWLSITNPGWLGVIEDKLEASACSSSVGPPDNRRASCPGLISSLFVVADVAPSAGNVSENRSKFRRTWRMRSKAVSNAADASCRFLWVSKLFSWP